MQEMSWGWVARIWWGVVWRWLLASTVVTVLLAFLAAIATKTTGNPLWLHPPGIGGALVILWTGLLGLALAMTLRARHGGFRLALVSTEDQAKVFD